MFSTSLTSPITTGTTVPRPTKRNGSRKAVVMAAKKEAEQRQEQGPSKISQLVGAVAAASIALTPASMANQITDAISSPAAREQINERTTDLPDFGQVGSSLKKNLAGIREDPEGAAESIRSKGAPGKIVNQIGKNIQERESNLPSPSEAGKVGDNIKEALPSKPFSFSSLFGGPKQAVSKATSNVPSAQDVGKNVQDALPSNPLTGVSNPLKGNTPDLPNTGDVASKAKETATFNAPNPADVGKGIKDALPSNPLKSNIPSPGDAKQAVDKVSSDLPSPGDVGSTIKDALPSNPLKGFLNPLKGNTPDLPEASDVASKAKETATSNAPNFSDVGKGIKDALPSNPLKSNIPSPGDAKQAVKDKVSSDLPSPGDLGSNIKDALPSNPLKGFSNPLKGNTPDLPSPSEAASAVDRNTPDLPSAKDLGKNLPNAGNLGDKIKSNLPNAPDLPSPSDLPNPTDGLPEKGRGLPRNVGFDLGEKAKDLAEKVDRNTPDLKDLGKNLPNAGDLGKNTPDLSQAGKELQQNLPDLPRGAPEKGRDLQRNVGFDIADKAEKLADKVNSNTPDLPSAKDLGKNLPDAGNLGDKIKGNLPNTPDLPTPQGVEKGKGLQRNVGFDLAGKAQDLADKVNSNTPDLPSGKDLGKNLPDAGNLGDKIKSNLPNAPDLPTPQGVEKGKGLQRNVGFGLAGKAQDLADKVNSNTPDLPSAKDLGKNLPDAGNLGDKIKGNLPNAPELPTPQGVEKGKGLQRNVNYQFSPKDAPQPDQSDLADKMGRKVPDPTASDDLGKAFEQTKNKLTPGDNNVNPKEVAGDVVQKLKDFIGDSN